MRCKETGQRCEISDYILESGVLEPFMRQSAISIEFR
jgi:hypothetical protein